jgi:hypothetical protein
VVVAGKTSEADADGRITLQLAPGPVEITVVKDGFKRVTVSATAVARPQVVPILLEPQAAHEAPLDGRVINGGIRLIF